MKFEEWKDVHYAPGMHTEKGRKFDKILRDWVKSHTLEEVLEIMKKHAVPCIKIYNLKDAVSDPHYNARGDFIEWIDETLGERIKGWGIVPKFAEPVKPKIWRGAPRLGQDARAILSKILGFNDTEIDLLLKEKIVCCE